MNPIHPVYAAMGTTIFEEMSGLSRELGAINLGQGFPDTPGSPDLLEAAARALHEKSNQYPPSAGLPELRDAVAAFYGRSQGLELRRDEVIVTSGATEALAAALLALVQPGDEVVVFEPAYDAYAPLIERAGGEPVSVALAPPGWAYGVEKLEGRLTARTRLLILNDPLNPAGSAASAAELAALADLCVRHDLIAVCDEVWEGVRFDGARHRSLLDFPGMGERAVKIGSAGKLFGLTGWKIGWICARGELATALARAHQFLTFTSPPALQWAVAEGLAKPEPWFADQTAGWAASRERLRAGLTAAGYVVLPSVATWFLCVDLAASGVPIDDRAFSARAVREAGVASIPLSALFGGDAGGGQPPVVRLCFTKPDAVIDEAVARLAEFRSRLVREGA